MDDRGLEDININSICWLPLLGALALFAPAGAASEYTIYGVGGRPCGSWLQARTQTGTESALMQSWLLGYITSVNAYQLTISSDIAEGTDPDGMFHWIDDYCTAHPLDSVARAATGLVGALRSNARSR